MKLEDFFNTPEKRVRLFRLFWWISLFMMLLGFFFMFVFWNRGV